MEQTSGMRHLALAALIATLPPSFGAQSLGVVPLCAASPGASHKTWLVFLALLSLWRHLAGPGSGSQPR
ncbi:MAG: hypothetical protein Q8N44_05280 [Rubrivivax sp.]|nr:hypothetical protein [Rubrivivax sp.]